MDPVTDRRHEDIARIVDILRARREELGLSQWELAIRTGSSQSRISEIETGATVNPGVSSLAVIARALGMRLGVLDEAFFIEEIPNVGTFDEGL